MPKALTGETSTIKVLAAMYCLSYETVLNYIDIIKKLFKIINCVV